MRSQRLAEVQTLLAQATKAEHEASAALERVRSVTTPVVRCLSRIGVSFKDELEAELAGASSELGRLTERHDQIEAMDELQDLESDVLRKLAAIRAAIAGEVQDAHSGEAVRVALMRLFERFVIHVDGENGRIDAIVRDEAVQTVDEQLRPILRPVGLDLEPQPDATNNVAQGLPWRVRAALAFSRTHRGR